jgi:Fe-S cluster biogenesis protein NfuA
MRRSSCQYEKTYKEEIKQMSIEGEELREAVQGALKEQVEKSLNSFRPYLQADGGDVELVDVNEEGVVFVRLAGACRGCPGATMTLQMGVERILKQQVPEVKSVVAVQ